ncbi:hypothetical protein SISSUDRAFT_1034900 [Sistotremastrum suecicum HHB10207 ss-3]|uniref:Uncharacterized protein n=1 Tax=Sistotremastrum suecicum HHB10207 ss-3 TaxID=1314776 RepID=A0A166BHM4_9AGAM|nr:hypothetical protein SISSUDRAFT_1034900 [Sistotremastrum suecicum HHB10207 ss-3]
MASVFGSSLVLMSSSSSFSSRTQDFSSFHGKGVRYPYPSNSNQNRTRQGYKQKTSPEKANRRRRRKKPESEGEGNAERGNTCWSLCSASLHSARGRGLGFEWARACREVRGRIFRPEMNDTMLWGEWREWDVLTIGPLSLKLAVDRGLQLRIEDLGAYADAGSRRRSCHPRQSNDDNDNDKCRSTMGHGTQTKNEERGTRTGDADHTGMCAYDMNSRTLRCTGELRDIDAIFSFIFESLCSSGASSGKDIDINPEA